MSKLVILPVADENTQPTYHLKSDYSQINFSEFNVKRDYDFEEKNPSENYSQIYITTSYTISIDNSEHFCRFDIISPFEVNKQAKDFSKEEFLKLLDYHKKYVEKYIEDRVLNFPNGFKFSMTYKDLDVDLIADKFSSLYK